MKATADFVILSAFCHINRIFTLSAPRQIERERNISFAPEFKRFFVSLRMTMRVTTFQAHFIFY